MKLYIITIALSALLSAGCKKGLDLVPKDTISDVTFWKTAADYELAANNLYNSLEDFSQGDNESDISFNVANAVSNGSYQAPETDSNWIKPYTYIRRCNLIIEKSVTSDIANEVKQYAAEAKFFRAYNYWRLYRLYGGVPLITKLLDVNSEELFQGRATNYETVDYILKDLTDAVANLPEQKNLAAGDKGRITKGAANALKARVALYAGTWDKYRGLANANKYLDIAIEASTTVMNNSQYSLYTGKAKQSYRYQFIDEGDDSPETILDRRHQRDIAGGVFNRVVSEGGYLPTKKLADMYLCSDGLPVTKSPLFLGYNTTTSEFQNRDPRMTMSFVVPGTAIVQSWYVNPVASYPFYPQRNPNTGYTTYKYLSEEAFANAINSNWSSDYHIIRFAEILLTYAEAIFVKNGMISDADLNKSINLIRQRVDMPSLTNAFVTVNALTMEQEIRRERTIELALENLRYDDLRRWKTAETELPQVVRGAKIVGTPWANPIIVEGADRNPYGGSAWQTKTDAGGFIIVEAASARAFNPNKHYLRPIPTKEVAINSALTQNPNW